MQHYAFAGVLIAVVTSAAAANPIELRAGEITYSVDPTTLRIDARSESTVVNIMPPLHPAAATEVFDDGNGRSWHDGDGRTFRLSVKGGTLRLTVSGKPGTNLSWPMPPATTGTWLIPDGEGMAYKADDPFWQNAYHRNRCLGGTTMLSFPAWSYLTENTAITYALGDGFRSRLCLQDKDGVQAELVHDFADGAEIIDLMFAVRPPEPLAPALFYREFLKAHGQFKPFASKTVPDLPRLFAAPHAYVWGDGRDLAFLNDLKRLGIARIVLSYDQNPNAHRHLVGPEYLKKAYALGYLAGPYDTFDNGQSAKTADSPAAIWPDDLYPSGCIRDNAGRAVPGFGNRGCEMSSEAVARHIPFVPAKRYARHIADGASEVFVDVDAFGEFHDDFSPDHPMTMAKDRTNKLARMETAIGDFHLVLGSENVTAWSAGTTHYSHGTAQAHTMAVWPLLRDKRFGGWWPPERPTLFFSPFVPTPGEARALFDPADRLPLFEAVFHDAVVAVDRWEFGLMKVPSQARNRFARALLYGTPTMWNLDRRELARTGAWLKAAHDDFTKAHGSTTPDALTGFAWLTPDRLVQQARYAGGRVIIANFGREAWQGLDPECVRVSQPGDTAFDLCPPPDPAPFRP